MPVALPLVKAGRVKAMGVTGAKRAAVLPEMPTIAEPAPSTPERASAYLRSETEKYAKVVKAIGLRID